MFNNSGEEMREKDEKRRKKKELRFEEGTK